MRKHLVAVLLIFTIVMSIVPISVFADAEQKEITIEFASDKTITVVLPTSLSGKVDESEIKDLINVDDLSDGDTVTLLDVGYCTGTDEQGDSVEPNAVNYRATILGYGTTEYKVQNYFVISVAKGQVTTLVRKFSQSIHTSFGTGSEAPYLTSQIRKVVTAEYSTTQEFAGPPEMSAYNSREYRVQFYARDVYWKQDKLSPSGGVVESRTGVGTEPTKYLLYSVDHKLS